MKERGRFYPDDSEDKGRLLSAGFHNVMGYFARRYAAQRTDPGREGQAGAGAALGSSSSSSPTTPRAPGFNIYFNQSGEVQGNGRRVGHAAASGQGDHGRGNHFQSREHVSRQGGGRRPNNPIAMQAIRDHFQRVNDTLPPDRTDAGRSRTAPAGRADDVCGARVPQAAVAGRARQDPGDVLSLAAREEAVSLTKTRCATRSSAC